MNDKGAGPAFPGFGAAVVAGWLRENMSRRLPRAGDDYRRRAGRDQARGHNRRLSFLLFAAFILHRA
ncbi:MAG TPA: hypothetical protein VEA60_07630, partial [Allosphingosinicella sp.]|nr:hypothetical protein [Allosphingosinicella sp.]